MCQLFETIRILDGLPVHLAWHEQRMNESVGEFWPGAPPVKLKPLIVVPAEFRTGVARCRVTYGPDVREISFSPYEQREIRTLKIIRCDDIDYHAKFTDRRRLDELFAKRGEYDDILIVRKGLITDTSIANIIFFDGKSWITPSTPLLNGACRRRLLHEKRSTEREIRVGELAGMKGWGIVNSMRDAGCGIRDVG